MILNIIITSTRLGRVGGYIGEWFYKFAKNHNCGFEIMLTDLAELNLPLKDVPDDAVRQKDHYGFIKSWSNIVNRSDAFVFVVPEHSFLPPASFINAVNYLKHEWAYKAAGIISYGIDDNVGRAAQCTRILLNSMNIMVVPEQVSIYSAQSRLRGDDIFVPMESQVRASEDLLEAISRWSLGLRQIRDAFTPQNFMQNIDNSILNKIRILPLKKGNPPITGTPL